MLHVPHAAVGISVEVLTVDASIQIGHPATSRSVPNNMVLRCLNTIFVDYWKRYFFSVPVISFH